MPSQEGSFDALIRLFEDRRIEMKHVIEHQDGGQKNVTGRYTFHGGNFTNFVLGWSQEGGFSRTTQFSSTTWKCEVKGNIAFLTRTAEDPNEFDIPWKTANLYTIVFGPRREAY